MSRKRVTGLSKKEELELGKILEDYKQNKSDKNKETLAMIALEKLVEANLGWAIKYSLAMKERSGVQIADEDLRQEAAKILIESAWNYDTSKNCKLNTITTHRLFKYISIFIDKQRSLPTNGYNVKIYNFWVEKYKTDKDTTLSLIDYISLNSGLSRASIEITHNYLKGVSSLDYEITNKDNTITKISDVISDDSDNYNNVIIRDLLKTIDSPYKEILENEFDINPVQNINTLLDRYNINTKAKYNKAFKVAKLKFREKYNEREDYIVYT